jgi:hypothetical protein
VIFTLKLAVSTCSSYVRKLRLGGFAVALMCIIMVLIGCATSANITPPPQMSITPSSTTVAVGATATFTAVFGTTDPSGSSLAWTVVPASGGTITSGGVYTASATPGTYSVVATWTSQSHLSSTTASASVDVIPAPQTASELNFDIVQASGASQASGSTTNGAVIGQLVPWMISADPADNIQVGIGFTPPVPCSSSSSTCTIIF